MARRLISFHAMEIQFVEGSIIKALDEDGAWLMFPTTEPLTPGTRLHVTIEMDDEFPSELSLPPDPDHEASPEGDAALIESLKRIASEDV